MFQNAKVPNAKGPREQPHTSPRRHSHVVGLLYYTRWGLSNSCDGYCSRGWARPQGAKSTENTRAKQPKKKMTLPLSGASNRLSVTSRQRKRRITSHDKDTARKDSTFTQERRASAQHSAATILPDMAGGSRDPRAPLLYSYCDDCYKRAPLLNCKVETTRL